MNLKRKITFGSLTSLSLIFSLLLFSGSARAEVTPEDAAYAKSVGEITQKFTAALSSWGVVYQSAPTNFNSPKYKNWMKKAAASDNKVKAVLADFSKLKVTDGYAASDKTMREFIKSYRSAINLFSPAIKKNDAKLMKKANDSIMKATALFSAWSNEFAADSTALTQ